MRHAKIDTGILPQCYIDGKVKCRDRRRVRVKFKDGNHTYVFVCENGCDEELNDCPHDKNYKK